MTKPPHHVLWLLVATLAAPCLGAMPEVVRVRVPATKVDAWFPRGTELISVPIDEFNALLGKVDAATLPSVDDGRGILAAAHRARWDNGILVGTSTFRVRRDPTRPVVAAMSPWGPGIDCPEARDFQVRTDPAGNVTLWLAPEGGDEVRVRWRLPARPLSSGHVFRFELPRVVPTTLDLDLPDSLRPDGPDFARVVRAEASKGRSEWRQTGRSGAFVLRLRTEGEEGPGSPWVSGPTTVDIGPGVAHWRVDWQVDLNGIDRPLIVELSPGLEPIEVTGPGVESSQFARKGDRSEVAIHFRPATVGTTAIVLKASAAIPAEGVWRVPSARPKNAVWTGGLVTVQVDPPMIVRSCRVLQGRRVAPGPGNSDGRTTLAFEPTGADPVAELSVADRAVAGLAEVRGLIRVEGAGASFVAEVRGSPGRGGVPDRGFTLSPGWSIDGLTSAGDPLTWQQEPTPEGPTRVRVTSPPLDPESTAASLTVRATRTGQVDDRGFEAPRIGVPGDLPGEETWAALVDVGRVMEPEGAVGLAWLAPTDALTPTLRATVDPPSLSRALGWRWTGPGGRLTIAVGPEPREVDASLAGIATIADGRLRLDWRASIRPGSRPIAFLPLFVADREVSIDWRRPDGSALPVRRLTLAERVEAGFPKEGAASGVVIDDPAPTKVELVGVEERPWSPGSDLPLLHLPDSYRSRATLAVRVERDRLTALRSEGVHDLETEGPATLPVVDRFRTAHRIGYTGLDARARVVLVGEAPVDPAAIVGSARQETRWDEAGVRIDRLAMDVTWGATGPIRFRPRPGSRLVSVSVDGAAIAPTADGPDVVVPHPNRPQSRIVLEWQATADPSWISPAIPAFSIPCLGLTWTVDLPPSWTLTEVSGRLVAVDPLDPGSPLVNRPARSVDATPARFEVRGWPDDGDRLRIEPGERAGVRAIGLSLAILIGGLAVRLIAPRFRVGAVVGIGAATAFLVGVGDRVPAWLTAGMLVGAVGTWVFQIAGNRAPAPRRSPSVGSRSAVAIAALAALALVGARSEGPPDAILVLLPYDPAAGPDLPPRSALLRLSDHARLRAIVEAAGVDRPATVSAVETTHRLHAEENALRIETEFALVVDGPKPGEWRVPTEGATGIEVSLDGDPHPCRIVEEGRAAVVAMVGAGRHVLKVRRSVRIDDGRFEVAVTPVPSARVTVSGRPIDLKGDGLSLGPDGLVGPTSILAGTVRAVGSGKGSGRPTGFSALALWDARPAGDLVQVRLTPEGVAPVAEVRLAVEAGDEVRAGEPSRVVATTRTNRAWIASFDPPIRADQPLTIEVWRPRTSGRRSIRVAMADGTRFSGVLALRRTADWSGRLVAAEGLDTIDEPAFARAWGTLPADRAELAGTSGFQSVIEAEVDCGPSARRSVVQPVVRLDAGEGRLDVEVRAQWRTGTGEATGLDVGLPPDLRVDAVTADGLIGVGRPGPGRLHLEFERTDTASRTVTIRGFCLVAADSSAASAGRFRLVVPWPSWGEATEEAGVLTIGAARKPVLEHGPGVSSLAAAEPFAGGSGLPTFRKVFGVTRPADLGPLAWGSAPSRVSVFLHSQLALTARSSELTSTIRYEIAGEPIEAFYIKIPTAWAGNARVDLVGHPTRPTVDARGAWTYLTIRPDRPVWGAARLLVRAGRREARGQAIRFPDISPLGQGSVDKTISVRKRTRLPIELEGSPGLQSVDVSRIAEPRLSDALDPVAGAYRVTTDDWTLGVRVVDPSGADGDAVRPVVASDGDWDATIDVGGNLLGTFRAEIEARRGGTLGIDLEPPARPLWATVGGRSTPVFATAPGRWEIPIDEPGPGRVELVWSGPAAIPTVEGAEGPTLGTIVAEPSILVWPGPTYEPIDAAELAMAHVDRLARRIATKVGELDRSRPGPIAELRSLLADHEIACRAAIEAQGSAPIVGRVDRSRAAVRESLELHGLEDLGPSAKAVDGRLPPSPTGRATHYRSTPVPVDRAAISWTRAQGAGSRWWLGAIAAVIVLIGGPRLAAIRWRPAFGIVAAPMLLVAAFWMPIPSAIVVFAAWLGRTSS